MQAPSAPYTGSTWDLHDRGLFRCVCCDNALFNADTKFESGTGWPSFWQPIAKENIVEIHDNTLGMERVAVSCRAVRCSPGSRFRRWSSSDRPALLHEFGRDALCETCLTAQCAFAID